MRSSHSLLPLVAALGLGLAPAALHAQEELPRPDTWQVRADQPGHAHDDVYFVEMPPGWHITTGPAVILWDPAVTAGDAYSVESEIYLFDPEGRREAFGVFVGGRDLDGPDQEYVYFLIREGGQYLVKRREGTRTATVRDWTSHPAIVSFATKGDAATAKNVLALDVDAERVRFRVNGEEVVAVPRSELPSLDGVVGMRVNHGLNLHVSRLEVSPR